MEEFGCSYQRHGLLNSRMPPKMFYFSLTDKEDFKKLRPPRKDPLLLRRRRLPTSIAPTIHIEHTTNTPSENLIDTILVSKRIIKPQASAQA